MEDWTCGIRFQNTPFLWPGVEQEDWSGGLLCNPPFLRGGERERGGMDLEAEGRHEEVQNASRCTKAEDQTSHLCKKLYKIS